MSHVIDSDRGLRRNNNTRYRDENKSNSLQFDRCIYGKRKRVKEKGNCSTNEGLFGSRPEAKQKRDTGSDVTHAVASRRLNSRSASSIDFDGGGKDYGP